ncbi:TonB-dependent receptor plug domain-containing protein [Amylibacter sp. SFDW26]|uniref:TonB-dependent receptor n=1 Tax=Amylibacter sp. SFDW26 TaxID=2652722 RepID=UPI0012614B14|nr:TonB-dependent receptor [Amylibacter sp. SFDW26]KAB7615847.1 TonB-dependent receptor plug domain-containing protein [Amylibacter sp. SFDW26]
MKRPYSLCLMTTASFFALNTITNAQELDDEPFALDEIVVEASRTGAPVSSIPGTVQVIDGDTLKERIGAGDSIATVLGDYVPGFAPNNGSISGASQTLRGRNVQILLNGIPRSSELRGFNRDLALINPDSIASIEVIKGSSAIFGNGATGGLINIVTKAAEEEGTHYSVSNRVSFQDTDISDSLSNELAVSVDHRKGDFGIRVDGSFSTTGNSFDGAGRQRPSDPLIGQGGGDNVDRYTIGTTIDYAWGASELEFNFNAIKLDQDIEFNSDYSTNPVSIDTTSPYAGQNVFDDTKTASATYKNTGFGFADIDFTVYYSDSERRAAFVPVGPANPLVNFSGDPANPQDPNGQSVLFTEQYGARLAFQSGLNFLSEGATLTYGVDYGHDAVRQQTVGGTPIISPISQDSIAAFAQAEIPIGQKFELSLGSRAEKFFLDVGNFTRPAIFFSTAGVVLPAVDVTGTSTDYSAVVFNIGGVYHATPKLDIFAGLSQGFSIPDVGAFTRRAQNTNPFDATPINFGSIQPDAQIVNTYEIGARYTTSTLRISGSAFLSTSDDGTTFDATTNTITQQKEEIWGAELLADYKVNTDWNVGALFSFTEGRFDSDNDGQIDDWLPNNRIPAPYTATVYSDYAFASGFKLSGDVVLSSARTKVENAALENNVRINLRGSYQLGNGVVSAGIDNLFDTNQLNAAATSVRNIAIADEGRRIWVAYGAKF